VFVVDFVRSSLQADAAHMVRLIRSSRKFCELMEPLISLLFSPRCLAEIRQLRSSWWDILLEDRLLRLALWIRVRRGSSADDKPSRRAGSAGPLSGAKQTTLESKPERGAGGDPLRPVPGVPPPAPGATQ